MKSFTERFFELKTRVGGNREKSGFEHTFGMPREAQAGITAPAAHICRIISETDFAIKLDAVKGGIYAPYIDKALSILEAAMEEDGTLTKSAAAKAEAELLPLRDEAKSYEVICASHAHIDMNWQWPWHETVAITLATFRTILKLMREYPEFTYSQSQASVYKIVEDFAPEMMDEIKQRINEGRWEITATAWVETDKNMPDTESLLRHVKYTRNYLEEVWGIDPASLQIDFSPDTFGHSANLPELNNYANVKYYYHCRGLTTENVLYRWKAPSGRDIMIYREPYWYNSGINPDIATGIFEMAKFSGGLKTGLVVYGVGDHGGGPTRRDIEKIIEYSGYTIFPTIKFGTLIEYFKKAESVRENLPYENDELNFIFTGCYTTQSRIKRGNRRTEAALLNAETLCAFAPGKAPVRMLEKAWRNVLFTHFHDIITGSCVQDSREHAMGLYQESLAASNSATEKAMLDISERIDTSAIKFDNAAFTQSEGAGVGFGISGVPSPERGRGKVRAFHIFNPLAYARKEAFEITVWDWTYDMKRIKVTDVAGKELEFQLIDTNLQHYWDHKYFRILVNAEIPAFGYATVVLNEKKLESYPTYRLNDDRIHHARGKVVLENEFICATFDGEKGELVSLIDKESGKEFIDSAKSAGAICFMSEAETNDAWHIGRRLGAVPSKTIRVEPFEGSLRSGLRVKQKVLDSDITLTITLDKYAKELAYSIEVDWYEATLRGGTIPVLSFDVPLAAEPECFRYDIPGGAKDRASDFLDRPGLTHAAALYGKKALALVTDCKYGYRGSEKELSATLINTSHNPDQYPERGIHSIKLWIALSDSKASELKKKAMLLCRTPAYISATEHSGDLPADYSFINAELGGAVVSSLFEANDGSVIMRIYDVDGNGSEIKVTPDFTPSSAAIVDGDEKILETLDPASCTFRVKPYSVTSLKLTK